MPHQSSNINEMMIMKVLGMYIINWWPHKTKMKIRSSKSNTFKDPSFNISLPKLVCTSELHLARAMCLPYTSKFNYVHLNPTCHCINAITATFNFCPILLKTQVTISEKWMGFHFTCIWCINENSHKHIWYVNIIENSNTAQNSWYCLLVESCVSLSNTNLLVIH